MKSIDLFGIGNGIIDVLVEVSNAEFKELKFEKGSMMLLSTEEQKELLTSFAAKEKRLVSGGSVANSTVLFAQLGGRAAFACRLADDPYGLHYKSEFESLGIKLSNSLIVGGSSGTSVIMITPDAERTMRTSLGVSANFSSEDVEEELIRQSKWIFIEGYLFSNPDKGQKCVRRAIELAKEYNTKVAITLSDTWVVQEFRTAVEEALRSADLVFANDKEAMVLTDSPDGEAAFEEMVVRYPQVVVTQGAKGCLVKSPDFSGAVDSYRVSPVDLTGAGDAFAGGYLFGITRGLSGDIAAQAANFMAAQVIQRVGARLHGDPKELWQSVLA